MFSGKIAPVGVAGRRPQSIPVAVFKHACDDRYHEELVTHNGRRATRGRVGRAYFALVGDARLVVIDEAQFFGIDLVDMRRQLAEAGCSVVLAGLDRDLGRAVRADAAVPLADR